MEEASGRNCRSEPLLESSAAILPSVQDLDEDIATLLRQKMVILSRLYYWPYFSSGRTSSLRVLRIACFAMLLFVPSNSSGFSKDGTLPHLSTAQADVENGG